MSHLWKRTGAPKNAVMATDIEATGEADSDWMAEVSSLLEPHSRIAARLHPQSWQVGQELL